MLQRTREDYSAQTDPDNLDRFSVISLNGRQNSTSPIVSKICFQAV